MFILVILTLAPVVLTFYPPTPRATEFSDGATTSLGNTSVVPTFFLLSSFTCLFEDFYHSMKEYIGKSVFVAVQDSCTYAGTKLCLNDHYLCETFCLRWTIHHCRCADICSQDKCSQDKCSQDKCSQDKCSQH